MSDAYYQQRAARRTRIGCALGGLVVLVLLALFGVRSLYHDACTNSFDRSPEAVVRAYAQAVRRGDAGEAQQCWEHDAYYDLEAGCSEICLSRALGKPFEVGDVSVGEAEVLPSGRAARIATVSVVCQDGVTHSAEITLDSVRQELPWRHWDIVHSTFGGSVAEPWCETGQP
jgi:hypothetical protein